jgi:hypothetical protein
MRYPCAALCMLPRLRAPLPLASSVCLPAAAGHPLYTIHTLAADPPNFNQKLTRAIYFDTRTFRPALHDIHRPSPT